VILSGLFRRRPALRDPGQLADFIDENSAFLVQKGIYEYSRARAGHYAKILFAEAAFRAAIDESRWRAYPLGLALVTEVVEGALRSHAGDDRLVVLRALSALVLSVFDGYPVPAVLGEQTWEDLRSVLARRVQLIGLHAPKRVVDVAEPLAEDYFNLLPIHERLRGHDFPTTRNYLKVTLCNIHETFSKRADAPALVAALRVT
jgi:hypothetical protein